MSGLDQIIGQEPVIEHLRTAVLMERISHAYILEGDEGSGKKLIARTFAKTIQCEVGGLTPCGKCHSCLQMESGSQPDVIYVNHENPGLISVDEIRNQITKDISIRPYSSPRKIYIVDEAQKMNEQAQNALLKTLEEPPEYAVIMLLTSNAETLLPTIRSRCVTLKLTPLSDEQVRTYLTDHLSIPAEQARVCAAFAQGSIGRALLLAHNEKFMQVRASAVELLKRMSDIDSYEMKKAIKQVQDYKIDTGDYLDLLSVWYRDVLRFKATQEADAIIFSDETMEILNQSNRFSYAGLEEILQAITTARGRLRANVSFDLTMELLLETIKENQK
ncbi:MAG: DNA polymerase III subunit delta' [Eubacterium sp.]|nr:DNA polymerase III subunit delta' [Eubacterium sp.]